MRITLSDAEIKVAVSDYLTRIHSLRIPADDITLVSRYGVTEANVIIERDQDGTRTVRKAN